MGILNLDNMKIDTEARQLLLGNYTRIYKFTLTFSLWGDQKEADEVIKRIRSGALFNFLEKIVNEGLEVGKIEAELHFQAEFILSQLSHVIQLIDKNKLNKAVILYKLLEEIMPEYQKNPRINEINETRNVIWDSLAKRGLL